jgi:tetratricopeptide (TPR) repeat protein
MKKYLFSILLFVLISCNNKPTYEDYNNHKPMHISVKGSTSETLDNVQKLFNKKNYVLANTHLSRLADYYIDNEEIQLYYGITFLETNQYPLAKIKFDKLLLSKNPSFINKANWYLALMALKQNNLETCKSYLIKIPKDSDDYKKANSLLEKI